MSKSKKRIILICVVLALLLTGTVAMFALAADTVPLPNNRGLARMRRDIYDMYVDGTISKDDFDRYAASFEINKDIDLQLGDSRYGHTVKINKEKGSSGSSKTTVEFGDIGMMNVRLYGSAAWNDEMVNNLDLRMNFNLRTRGFGYGYYRMKMGIYPYSDSNVLPYIGEYYSGEIDAILKAKSLYNSGLYNGEYVWRLNTNGYATASDFSYQLLDRGIAGTNGWDAKLEESGDHSADGKTVYQLVVTDKGGDQLRVANNNITYDDLATLQLEVYMRSTDTQNSGTTYTIPAKAVEIRERYTADKGYPSAIVFEFYGDEWLNMEDQVVITGFKPVQVKPEGGKAPSYDILDIYSYQNLTKKFGLASSTPVTDFAGNEIIWEGSTVNITAGKWGMDRKEAVVVGVDMSFSNFRSGEDAAEASYAESFSGPYDYITLPTLIMNEEMYFNEEAKGKVAIQLNLRYKDGTPVTSTLMHYYTFSDRNNVPYSELAFESIRITEDMIPQGEQIVIEKILHEELLQDRVGNINLTNDILMTGDKDTSVWPDQVSYLDTKAPDVHLDETTVVVRRKDNNENGEVESIQITVPFKVTDYTPKDANGNDLMSATASGTTAWVRLSNPVDGQQIKYKYTISHTTDFPDANASWKTGNMGKTGHSGYSVFGIANEKENIYLHMELSNLAGYEISETAGLQMRLFVHDMASNSNEVDCNIPIKGVDNVAPQLSLTNQKITMGSGGNSVNFNAEVTARDTNGINLIEYRFSDSMNPEDDKVTPYAVLYQHASGEAFSYNWSGSIRSDAYQDTGVIAKYLHVRSYDKNNNRSETGTFFSADLSKVISNYKLTEDIFQPSVQTGVKVSAPSFNGTLSAEASTRFTVVVPTTDENGLDSQDIYFRVIPASEMTDAVTALDPNAQWYLASDVDTGPGGAYYIYRNVTKVDGVPGWVGYYGEMDLYVASSNSDMLVLIDYTQGDVTTKGLVLNPDYNHSAEEGSTYSWSKIGTVCYAGDVDDAYSVSYILNGQFGPLPVTDPSGEELTAYFVNGKGTGPRYVKLNQTIAGTRVGVELENLLVNAWGADGIDFETSYAVLVRADEDGNIIKDASGNYEEVTVRIPLSNSLQQTLTVPDVPAEGESYTSGVYTWVIHIAQKGGGSSDFATDDFGNDALYLILDNAEVPENFGVLEHTSSIQVVDGYRDHQYVTNTIKPEEGKNTLDVINIGIAKPTAMMVEEYDAEYDTTTYSFSESLEQVQVNGITAYLKGVANSSEFGNNYQNAQFGKFTITADMTDSGYGTFLGQEVGTVEGIRFWNKANVDDYTAIEYIKKDQPYRDSSVRGVNAEFSQENGIAMLDVSFNVAWYMPGDNPLYENAEALKAALPNGKFGVIDGENTICYQLLMDNGKESPIYQFKLNLVKEVPQVYVDYAFGPYYENHWEDGTVDRYLENATLYFSNMFSEYSGLKVYHVHFVKGGTDYYEIKQLTDDEITNGYTITEGCSGYNDNYSYDRNNFGYQGTSINGTSLDPEGSESFFVIVDNSGNAVTIYPMDSTSGEDSDAYSEVAYEKHHTFEKFLPEKMSYVGFEDGLHLAALTYPGFDYMGDPVEAGFYFWNADSIDFRIDADRASTDEEKEALWVNFPIADDYYATVPNASGFAQIEARYQNELGFAVPYDPTVAQGEMISHTAEVRIYGIPDESGEANYVVEKAVTFQAPNTKPAISKVETIGGCIVITYNMAVCTDLGASNMQYIPVTDNSIYESSYTHTFQDLFGNEYTETFTVPADDGALNLEYYIYDDTNKKVVINPAKDFVQGPVYVSATTPDGKRLTLFNAPDGVEEDTIKNGIEIKVPFNCSFIVYHNDSITRSLIPYGYVELNNIYKSLTIDPYISWDYNAGDVDDGVVYGDVTAYLVDRNGQALLDPATGKPAQFTFFPGGPTEYTFSGCYSEITKTPVSDMRAKLEVTLEPEPITETDTLAPDVDIVAYLSNDTGSNPANMVYRKSSGQFAMTDYAFRYGMTDEECYYDDINKMIAGMGWSKSYMFHLDVHDDSRVKVIIMKDILESGITYNTASKPVEGVSVVGRTMRITKNCDFALYLVDEENNITALHIQVSNLTGAPVPELAVVDSMTADGKPAVRVYLLPPQINNYTNLKIVHADAKTDLEKYEDVTSDYYGLDYMLYSKSGKVAIDYSYEVPGYTKAFEGTLSANVTVREQVIPKVTNFFWSANYFNKATNQPVSLNLMLNVAIEDEITVLYNGQTLTEYDMETLRQAGMSFTVAMDKVTVYYENNTDAIIRKLCENTAFEPGGSFQIQMTELQYLTEVNGGIGVYDLPEVTNIDRVGPALEGNIQIEYPKASTTIWKIVDGQKVYEEVESFTDYKTAIITLNLDETVTSGDGRQKGTQFQYTVNENKTYTYSFMDEAGNRSSFHVEVTDLITDALKITLSTSASDTGIIDDPSTYTAAVGQTLYAKVNRDATISIYGKGSEETVSTVAKDTWTAVKVTENSMGMHPSVVARDNYGNTTIVQLEYIPIRDVTAPAAFLHRDTVSVAASATEAEIYNVLMANILYSDDSTAMDNLIVDIDYAKIASGRTVVTYTITDEEGNSTIRQGYLRIRSGLEPVIHVNGQLVEDGAFLYVTDTNDLNITVAFDGNVAEPFKMVYEEGDLRSWAKMKDGNWLSAGYDDQVSQTYQIADLGDGWYSFALTTQGMEVYYFQVHIGQIR